MTRRIIGAFAALTMMLAACAGSVAETPEVSETTVVETPEVSETTVVETTLPAPTTQEPPTTKPWERPPSGDAPSTPDEIDSALERAGVTTTTTPVTTTTLNFEDEWALAFVSAVAVFDDEMRRSLADAVVNDGLAETVDKVELAISDNCVDGDVSSECLTGTLVLDVTSRWRSEDNQHDAAWALTRAISLLWEPDGIFGVFAPGFQLTNSGRLYECDSSVMADMANLQVGRSDWEMACSG